MKQGKLPASNLKMGLLDQMGGPGSASLMFTMREVVASVGRGFELSRSLDRSLSARIFLRPNRNHYLRENALAPVFSYYPGLYVVM